MHLEIHGIVYLQLEAHLIYYFSILFHLLRLSQDNKDIDEMIYTKLFHYYKKYFAQFALGMFLKSLKSP